MSERILIPLPGLGTLELPREVFDQHLLKTLVPAPTLPSELVDADQLEERTGIPASWWMTQARERRVPFRKMGRYVRFELSEIMECDAYRRRALGNSDEISR
ncbi:hypothetical protein GCM10011487_45320 [Steroidobacter agaridevorans]|uniref:Uncharacterized protein n=1 Tax=Steroidobacter agaridevorans TaxID=2695856 RepID=A0A829YI76_9GAMM|nr:hypothetical protein GCM10011487_45320 [Steroidobacter agaridevorans]